MPDFDAQPGREPPEHTELSTAQRVADEIDLRAGLRGLAGMVAGARGVFELLGEVAAFAAEAIPGVDGAGVALIEVGKGLPTLQSTAATAGFVHTIDAVQYDELRDAMDRLQKGIDGIKEKLKEIAPSLPPGVRIVPTYDRSELIRASIATLREKLLEESLVVAAVCLIFLWHVRSSLVAIVTLPIAVLLSFLPMYRLGLTSNIMSLGGIAIAIGAMVDAAIIMIENAHKQLEHFHDERGRGPTNEERREVIIAAARSVGRPLFFSLLVITVSFVPVCVQVRVKLPLNVPPVLHIALPRHTGVLARRALALSVSCERGCKILVTGALSIPGRPGSVPLVAAARPLPATLTGHVRLRIGPSALRRLRRALGHHTAMTATVTVAAVGPTGRRTTVGSAYAVSR